MSVSGISGALPVMPAAPLPAAPPQALGAGPASSGFGLTLAAAVDGLSATQQKAGALAVQAVTGQLEDVHDYTIAATEAQVALELTVAVRNKAVEAFNEIMRMQA